MTINAVPIYPTQIDWSKRHKAIAEYKRTYTPQVYQVRRLSTDERDMITYLSPDQDQASQIIYAIEHDQVLIIDNSPRYKHERKQLIAYLDNLGARYIDAASCVAVTYAPTRG
ncbi:MAG: hypothetical protein Q4E09_06095 [Eubacteriales bacterium]|nr:hypothetical protein [Eubacteriales bacterium]